MALSSDLISQFVKVTKDEPKTKQETTVYGTVVERDGTKYVMLDGNEDSGLLTPMSTTVDAEANERVTVLIKDHTATVTGNVSSPSARTDTVTEIGNKITEVELLMADKVSTKQLDAANGRIDTLVSDNVLIKDTLVASEARIDTIEAANVTINQKLTAHEASIDSLETTKLSATDADLKYATITKLDATDANVRNLTVDYGDFKVLATDKLNANEASITELETKKLSATEADLKYANIDFSNIGEAAVEKFYAVSGIIKDLTLETGVVVKELVGVVIKGDLIQGNTIKADKLVVRGEDGLYYKLNVDALGETTVGSDEKYQNGLDGSVIIAKSVTAEKISVSDLVAFNATIGGFNITESSIYSEVKSAVDNTTEGIYFDKTGQIAFGDSNKFVKFYKDSDGVWRLVISADSISFRADSSGESNVKTVEEALEESKNELIGVIADSTNGILEEANNSMKDALDDYVDKDTYNTYVSGTSSRLDILNDNITANFETAIGRVDSVSGAMDSKWRELLTYIRFSSEGIEIGKSDNPIIMKLDNDDLAFYQNGVKVAYISNNKLEITDAQVNNSLQIGNYAFIPRSNGSLDFRQSSS